MLINRVEARSISKCILVVLVFGVVFGVGVVLVVGVDVLVVDDVTYHSKESTTIIFLLRPAEVCP